MLSRNLFYFLKTRDLALPAPELAVSVVPHAGGATVKVTARKLARAVWLSSSSARRASSPTTSSICCRARSATVEWTPAPGSPPGRGQAPVIRCCTRPAFAIHIRPMAYRIKRREPVGKGAAADRRRAAPQGRACGARSRRAPQEERVHEVRTRLKRSRAALALIRADGGEPGARATIAGCATPPASCRARATWPCRRTRFGCWGRACSPSCRRALLAGLSAAERRVRRALRPEDVERDLRRAGRGCCAACGGGSGDWDVPHGRRAISDGDHPHVPQGARRAGGGPRAAVARAVPRLAQAGQGALERAAHDSQTRSRS